MGSKKRELKTSEREILAAAIASKNWDDFDKVVVAFSGGKDSLACVLRLIDLGCPREKLELIHHDVDGREGSDLMDWPVTREYCRAVAGALGVDLLFSWKVGGFEREMTRDNTPTAPTRFETPGGQVIEVGGKGPRGTRLKFPQVGADLKTRWCSAYLKVDVSDKIFANDPRFNQGGRFLLVTGERREESASRAKYQEIELDRAATQKRNIIRWRAVIDFTEAEVWNLIEKHRIDPHPAYKLGFGRVSCAACIFGNPDQWAAVRELFPSRFEKIAKFEESFGATINRLDSVRTLADRGTSIVTDKPETEKKIAAGTTFDLPVINNKWTLPAGAFKACGGPS